MGLTLIFDNFTTVFEFDTWGGGPEEGGEPPPPVDPCMIRLKLRTSFVSRFYIPVIEIHVLKKSSLCMIDMSYSLYLLVKENWFVRIPKNTSSY